MDAPAVRRHPHLLLWAAQADEHHVRARRVDSVDIVIVLGSGHRPERRRVGAHHLQPRKLGFHALAQQFQRFRRAAVEVHLAALGRLGSEIAPHEVRSVQALLLRGTELAQHPRHGSTVTRAHVAAGDDLVEARIERRRHDRMDVAETDVARLPRPTPASNASDRRLPVEDIDRNADHGNPMSNAVHGLGASACLNGRSFARGSAQDNRMSAPKHFVPIPARALLVKSSNHPRKWCGIWQDQHLLPHLVLLGHACVGCA